MFFSYGIDFICLLVTFRPSLLVRLNEFAALYKLIVSVWDLEGASYREVDRC